MVPDASVLVRPEAGRTRVENERDLDVWLHFDAKYKLDWSSAQFERAASEREELQQPVAKRSRNGKRAADETTCSRCTPTGTPFVAAPARTCSSRGHPERSSSGNTLSSSRDSERSRCGRATTLDRRRCAALSRTSCSTRLTRQRRRSVTGSGGRASCTNVPARRSSVRWTFSTAHRPTPPCCSEVSSTKTSGTGLTPMHRYVVPLGRDGDGLSVRAEELSAPLVLLSGGGRALMTERHGALDPRRSRKTWRLLQYPHPSDAPAVLCQLLPLEQQPSWLSELPLVDHLARAKNPGEPVLTSWARLMHEAPDLDVRDRARSRTSDARHDQQGTRRTSLDRPQPSAPAPTGPHFG